jgi:hypothetical protein
MRQSLFWDIRDIVVNQIESSEVLWHNKLEVILDIGCLYSSSEMRLA